jgi:pimeloyl-ACP methyl ester carboxylesterase
LPYCRFALQQTYAADFDSLRTMKGAEIGDQLRREAVDTASRAFAPDSVGRLLKAALIPAMVVSGANDAGGTKSARAIAAAMPKAKLIVYPRTGLFTAWEQKERLISDVRAFLKSLDKPPR